MGILNKDRVEVPNFGLWCLHFGPVLSRSPNSWGSPTPPVFSGTSGVDTSIPHRVSLHVGVTNTPNPLRLWNTFLYGRPPFLSVVSTKSGGRLTDRLSSNISKLLPIYGIVLFVN